MHFLSLSIFATLACAAFSVAAPLSSPSDPENFEPLPRGLPPTPVAPLEVALENLLANLKPAVEALGNHAVLLNVPKC